MKWWQQKRKNTGVWAAFTLDHHSQQHDDTTSSPGSIVESFTFDHDYNTYTIESGKHNLIIDKTVRRRIWCVGSSLINN